MFVSDRKYLTNLLPKEALRVLVADDFDIFSGKSGRLAYDNGTVIFKVGEKVTGAGGAYGIVAAIIGDTPIVSGILVLNGCSGTFVNGETLTGNGSPNGAAKANGTLGPHVGNWTGFSVIGETVFAAIKTGEGDKVNVAQTFAANFECIKDLREIQLTSGAIMAHKINEA